MHVKPYSKLRYGTLSHSAKISKGVICVAARRNWRRRAGINHALELVACLAGQFLAIYH